MHLFNILSTRSVAAGQDTDSNAARVSAASFLGVQPIRRWEPLAIFLATFVVLAVLVPRITTFLSPITGDEPFYLMTDISIIKDGDLNECNNYRQRDEALIYPDFYSKGTPRPANWQGWEAVPYPLPPHPAQLMPPTRICVGANQYTPIDPSVPLPADGSGSELYSKHGLGLSLLVLPAFALGGYIWVVYFLAFLAALLAANLYLLAREGTGRVWPAILTWLAFAFTVPQLPYSFLIFPELPAALFVLYAFRRIRLWNNNLWQLVGVGASIAFIPWLHYRFLPVSGALALYFAFQEITHAKARWRISLTRVRDYALGLGQLLLSGLLLMAFFYQRYHQVLPNAADHAGSNDFAGTMRGVAGLLLDQQWGLLIAAPVYILAFVGVILMATRREMRKDLLWLGIVFVPYYGVIANYAQWWGEWCPPARYLASVLPLLALPFAISLDQIKTVAYKAVYGVLLALSFLVMWGYLYQPQWMYHQPDGKNNVIMHGLPELLSRLPGVSFSAASNVAGFLSDRIPSFVVPYYQYGQSKEIGDRFASLAWETSLLPIFLFVFILGACLILAWWSAQRFPGLRPALAAVPGGALASLSYEDTSRSKADTQFAAGGSGASEAAPEEAPTSGGDGQKNGHPPQEDEGLAPTPAAIDKASMSGHAPEHVAESGHENGPATVSELPDALQAERHASDEGDAPMLARVVAPPAAAEEHNGHEHANAEHFTVDAAAVADPGVEAVLEPVNGHEGQEPDAATEPGALVSGHEPVAGNGHEAVEPEAEEEQVRARQRVALVVDTHEVRAWMPADPAVPLATDIADHTDEQVQVETPPQPLSSPEVPGETPEREPDINREPKAKKQPDRVVSVLGTIWRTIWRTRAFILGAAAIATAIRAQLLIIPTAPGAGVSAQAILESIRWYALAIVFMLFAWTGTYRNRSFLVMPLKKSRVESTLIVRSQARKRHRPARRIVSVWHALVARLPFGHGNEPTPHLAHAHEERPGLRILAPWRRLKARYPWVAGPWPRYVLALGVLGFNLWCATLIRTNVWGPHQPNSDTWAAVGGWGWLASLFLLLLVFFGERRVPVREVDDHADVEERTDFRIPRNVEIAIVLGIFVLGLALRMYRLGDWTTGMHGDEGEAGMNALDMLAGGTLEGYRTSPFETGWFSQPNFYYWGIALTMKVFGTDLFGLRMFATLVGSLMIVPFYLLVRQWFGQRTAIIAGLLLAFSDVAIHFSKQEFSNITTPAFLVAGFYFFFRGLRTKGTLNFIIAGYMHMLSMYFYLGGRLTPILLVAVIAYIFILMPILRIPGSVLSERKEAGVGWVKALGRGALAQARTVVHYYPQVLIFAIACLCFASPFLFYFLDHRDELDARANDKFILNNQGRMASQYASASTAPLYVGLRMPTSSDVWPWMPIVFEQTPLSFQLNLDGLLPQQNRGQGGFWPRVIWDQLTTTLSIFTYRGDASSVYTFTGEPVAKPLEAAILILGIAFAFWRWRDTRFAILSMWFWMTILVGGVLTIDAPYMARLVGVIPVVAIFIAVPLNKFASEFVNIMSWFGRWRHLALAGKLAGAAALAGVLWFLGAQNYTDYFQRYLTPWTFTEVTGQAYFVRQMTQQAASEGRPTPKYYDLGAHFIYWGHGDNRFLNHGTPGLDMVNPTNELPVTDNGDRDIVFMVWDNNKQYLDVLKSYYPDGTQQDFVYGPNGAGPHLFTSYRVKKEQVDERRFLLATYTPAQGPAIQRQETTLGSHDAPPADLKYPVRAAWQGDLVAPAYGRYRFSLDTPGDGTFTIDGRGVLTTSATVKHAEADIVLARGPHDITLQGALAAASDKVVLQWSAGGQGFAPVPRQYLWHGPAKALLGEIHAFSGTLSDAPTLPKESLGNLISVRTDGFLGFRDAPNALSGGASLLAIWKGTLTVTQPGTYTFDAFSNGDSVLFIDGKLVMRNIQGGTDPHSNPGQIALTPGDHNLEFRYSWLGGTGYLEAYWTTPDGQKKMLGPDNLHADGGIVDAVAGNEPPPVQIQPPTPPPTVPPEKTVGADLGLNNPRGLDVDSAGNIYIGDRSNHRVLVVSPDGKVLRSFGKAGPDDPAKTLGPGEFNDIVDVAVTKDGKAIFVMDTKGNRLQAFDADGHFKYALDAPQLHTSVPNGIGVASDGTLYITDTAQNKIIILPHATTANPTAGMTSVSGEPPNMLEQPVDVAPDPTTPGQFYVTDLKQRIVLMKQDGKVLKQWIVQVGTEEGGSRLAIAPDGSKVYMSDPDRKRVDVVNTKDSSISYFGQQGRDPGQFQGQSGAATGPNGRIYILDRTNDTVQVFPPQ